MTCVALTISFTEIVGQVGINNEGASHDASAVLDLSSNAKGLLIPRMNAYQRAGISPAANGLLVYQLDGTAGFYYYNGTVWIYLGNGQGGGGHVIDMDGNTYPTVRIGDQEWVAENLRVTHYRNGEVIPNVTDNPTWIVLTTGAYRWYNNNETSYKIPYGALYNWFAVNDSRNLCPASWHVPTDAELTTLTTYLGGLSVAGGKTKAGLFWTIDANGGATNISGFSAIPGGTCYTDGGFFDIGRFGSYWSSTGYSTTSSWLRTINYNNTSISSYYDFKQVGYSVRCLRD